jgi:hypothetical protein
VLAGQPQRLVLREGGWLAAAQNENARCGPQHAICRVRQYGVQAQDLVEKNSVLVTAVGALLNWTALGICPVCVRVCVCACACVCPLSKVANETKRAWPDVSRPSRPWTRLEAPLPAATFAQVP